MVIRVVSWYFYKAPTITTEMNDMISDCNKVFRFFNVMVMANVHTYFVKHISFVAHNMGQ